MNPSQKKQKVKQASSASKKTNQVQKKTITIRRANPNPMFKAPSQNYQRQVDQFMVNKDYSRAVSRYLRNTLVPMHAMPGPAVAGATSGSTMLQTNVNIIPNSTNDGALFFTNHPKVPILQSVYTGTSTTFQSGTAPFVNLKDASKVSVGGEWFIEPTSSKIIPITVVNNPQFERESPIGNFIPGALTFSTALTSATVTMTNNTAASINFTVALWRRNQSTGAFVLDKSLAFSIAAGNTTPSTITPTDPTHAEWVIAITLLSLADGTVLQVTPTDLSIIVPAGYSWQPFNWMGTTSGTGATDNWFGTCTNVRVLMASLLLSNYTAEIYKSGQLSVCRMLHGQLHTVPTDPNEIIDWMTNNPTEIKNTAMQLKEGCYVPYIPSKIQDLEFKPRFEAAGDLSSNVQLLSQIIKTIFTNSSGWLIAWKVSDDSQFTPELKGLLTMVIEGVSNEQIVPQVRTPHIQELWTDWLAFIVTPAIIQENPKHIKALYNKVNAFVRDPDNRATIKKYGKHLLTATEVIGGLALGLL